MADQLSPFRGLSGITEIKTRMGRLSAHLKAFTPSCKTLTLKRKDYDLIKRWPKAANLAGFQINGDSIYFDGFELRYDKSPQRYER